MKVTLTPLPDSFPAYHPTIIFLEYFIYLYDALPIISDKVGKVGLEELHTGFIDVYESILQSVKDDGFDYPFNDKDLNAPVFELEVLVREYNPTILSYEEYKRSRSSRAARIDEILLELE